VKKILITLFVAMLLLPACVKIPKDALLFQPESLANRQLQTRRFDTANYETMLSASSAVFQDLGFSLDEAEYKLGVIVGSKRRDAVNAGQVTGAVFLALLTGVAIPVDRAQVIRASLVMREIDGEKNASGKGVDNAAPAGKGEGISTVRVTFQRVIYDTNGQVTRLEQINDPTVYQQFFDKLAQAVFLEAHEI
jgi:hypothetical protein